MAHACRLIANASEWQLHYSTFGPTENDLVLLNDNKTLMAVLRMAGASGCGLESWGLKWYWDGTYPDAEK